MKIRKVSLILAICMLMMCFSNITFADTNSWNAGAKINYVPYAGETMYRTSDWFKANTQELGLEVYEDLTVNASRWDVLAGMLRTYQAYLRDRGYNVLSANGATLTNFKDSGTLEPNAQSEAKIMVGIEMLSGVPEEDGLYMHMSDDVKRGEVAKVLAVLYQKLNPSQPVRNYNGFSDSEGHWAEEYIKYCYERDLLDGRGEDEFAPDGNITKEEAIQLLCNMNEYNKADGINLSHIAKAINETYKVVSAYYGNTNSSSSTSSSSSSYTPITPNEYSYTVMPNNRVQVTLKHASNRQVDVAAANENIRITGQNSSSGKTTVTVEGMYNGDSYLICRYRNLSYNDQLLIPIFVRSRNSSSSSLKVTLSQTNLSLNSGMTYLLSNDVTVRSSSTSYGPSVYYTSTNSTVASVDYYSGLINARSKGSCYIYILGYGVTKRVKVTVSGSSSSSSYYPYLDNYYSNFSLSEYYGELYVGRTLNLRSKVYNNTGNSLRFSSTNTRVATVSSTGIVTAKSAGFVVIRVYCGSSNNNYLEYQLQVLSNGYYDYDIPISQISFTDGDNVTIGIGEVFYLDDYVEVYPYYADRDELRYRSDDTSVAKVNSRTGAITGISGGRAIITVYSDYVNRYFYVFVDSNKVKVEDIQIANPTVEIYVNATYNLAKDVTVLPSNASNQMVFYTSEDMNIAFVSASTGLISGVSVGETNIVVEADGVRKKVKVVVKEGQGGTVTPPPVDPDDPTDTPIPDDPVVNPTNTSLLFVTNETIQIPVGGDFNPYSVLAGNIDGVTFSFSKPGYAVMENVRVIGVAKSNEVFYLIATNKYGSTTRLPIIII